MKNAYSYDDKSLIARNAVLALRATSLYIQYHGRLYIVHVHAWIVDAGEVPDNFAFCEGELEVRDESYQHHF